MSEAKVVPIHDNHFHCQPAGWKGVDAVRMFEAAGGTSILHVRLPAYSRTVDQFVQTVDDHLAFGQRIRDETGITVWSAIGPYPLEPLAVAKDEGWDAAEAFGRGCMDACLPYFESGQAHCLGEIGRPHFDVDSEAWEHSNATFAHGLAVAADAGVPAVLHTEHTEPETMAEFGAMADAAGLDRERTIKHYCGPLVEAPEHHGLFPSVIAGRSNIRKALAKQHGGRFMLETDYIDEPTRPNVVMPPDTVPKRVNGFLQSGDIDEATAWRIGDEWPRRFYE